MLFATGHNMPELVTVPYQDSVLHLHYWVPLARLFNYYLSCPDTLLVGIRQRTFKQYPTSCGLPFAYAYTIFYWTQDMNMPVNQALQHSCAGVPNYRHLRGNVLALKHRQSAADKFADMTSEDLGLVTSLISWCAQSPCCLYVMLTRLYMQCGRSRFARLCR